MSRDPRSDPRLQVGGGGGGGGGSPSLPSRPSRSQRRPVNAPGTPSPLTPQVEGGRFPDRPSSVHEQFRDNGFSSQSNRQGSGLSSPSLNSGNGGPMLSVTSAPGMSRDPSAASGASSSSSRNGGGSGGGDKSRRMMDNLNNNGGSAAHDRSSPLLNASMNSLPPSQRPRRDSVDSTSSTSSSSHVPQPESESNPASGQATPVLASAISAFSSAGQRRDGRRGGLADQGFFPTPAVAASSKKSTVLDPTQYPDTPAFREIEAVLRKVGADWPVLMTGTSADPEAEGGARDFDAVTLALGLLDPETAGGAQSLQAFLRMKSELDHAISATLAGSGPAGGASYRAYESSITTYNSTLASLARSQKQVAELKKNLGDVRERLEGKGREGLVGMWARSGHLEEMGKILDEMCALYWSLGCVRR